LFVVRPCVAAKSPDVLTYPTSPKPWTVDVSEVARPCVVEIRTLSSPEVLTYPIRPKPCVVEVVATVSADVLVYNFPSPWTVDTITYSIEVVLKYACPRPSSVEENLVELTYKDPKPAIVDVRPPALRY
jgi:hypothetical protein